MSHAVRRTVSGKRGKLEVTGAPTKGIGELLPHATPAVFINVTIGLPLIIV